MPSVWFFLGETDFRGACQMRVMPNTLLEQATKAEDGGQVKPVKRCKVSNIAAGEGENCISVCEILKKDDGIFVISFYPPSKGRKNPPLIVTDRTSGQELQFPTTDMAVKFLESQDEFGKPEWEELRDGGKTWIKVRRND